MPRQLTAHRAKTAPKPWTHSLQKRTTSLPSSPLTACQGLLQRQQHLRQASALIFILSLCLCDGWVVQSNYAKKCSSAAQVAALA